MQDKGTETVLISLLSVERRIERASFIPDDVNKHFDIFVKKYVKGDGYPIVLKCVYYNVLYLVGRNFAALQKKT